MSMEQLVDQIGHDTLDGTTSICSANGLTTARLIPAPARAARQEFKGVVTRDLRDCFVRAVLLSTGAEVIDGVDMRPRYEEANKGELPRCAKTTCTGSASPMAWTPWRVHWSLACEVERVMGIFPNVPLGPDVGCAAGRYSWGLTESICQHSELRTAGAATTPHRAHTSAGSVRVRPPALQAQRRPTRRPHHCMATGWAAASTDRP